jgi:hypothetical protein
MTLGIREHRCKGWACNLILAYALLEKKYAGSLECICYEALARDPELFAMRLRISYVL